MRGQQLVMPFAILATTLVGCGGGAASTVTVTVSDSRTMVTTAVPTPGGKDRIVVVQSGVAALNLSVARLIACEYGVSLRNPTSQDAAMTTVGVTFFDRSGTIVASDQALITLIPARTIYWLSGTCSPTRVPVRLRATTSVQRFDPPGGRLPEVISVRKEEDLAGHLLVTGTFKNTLKYPINGRLNVVALDRHGRIVGGALALAAADSLAPGERSDFTATFVAVSPKQVQRVTVSVGAGRAGT